MGEYPTPNIISLLKINNTYFDYLRVFPSFWLCWSFSSMGVVWSFFLLLPPLSFLLRMAESVLWGREHFGLQRVYCEGDSPFFPHLRSFYFSFLVSQVKRDVRKVVSHHLKPLSLHVFSFCVFLFLSFFFPTLPFANG